MKEFLAGELGLLTGFCIVMLFLEPIECIVLFIITSIGYCFGYFSANPDNK